MMMKRRREKFKRGFQVWPGKCFAGRGNFGGGCLGVMGWQREDGKVKLFFPASVYGSNKK